MGLITLFREKAYDFTKDGIVGLKSKAGLYKKSHPDDTTEAIIGTLKDDKGDPLIADVVKETALELAQEPEKNIFSYSSSRGLEGLADKIAEYFLGDELIEQLGNSGIKVASSTALGGTGAIHSILQATNKEGYAILHQEPYWPGYDAVMANLSGSNPVSKFKLLDAEGKFNKASFEETLSEALQNRQGATILLNTPFDNPLGQKLKPEDIESIANIINSYTGKNIRLVLDTAYADYSFDENAGKPFDFIKTLFDKVKSDSFEVMLAASLSKSFTMYGSRVGAGVLLSRNEEHTAKWSDFLAGAARGTYSSGPRFGQAIALNILSNKDKLKRIKEFQKDAVKTLKERLAAFKDAAAKVLPETMKIIEPAGGFFAAIKMKTKEEANRLTDKLQRSGIFIPQIGEYFRIPLCGLSKESMDKLLNKIMSAKNWTA